MTTRAAERRAYTRADLEDEREALERECGKIPITVPASLAPFAKALRKLRDKRL
jgi:hypothetical protein